MSGMYRQRIAFIGILGWSLFISGLYAQKSQPVFEAFTDTRELFQDSYLELSLVLRNGEGTQFTAPDFSDFRVVSGPSRGISTTIINGVVSMEMRFSYTLQPRRTGTLRIGAASIKVGSRTLRTRPVDILVRKGGAQDSGSAKGQADFFVRAELSKTNAFSGEQVRLDYNLYTRVDIQSYNMVEESPYQDFYVEDLQRVDSRVTQKMVKGKMYYVRTLRSLALYPQKAGSLSIGPASLELGILTNDPGTESLFFGGEIRRSPAVTESLQITVSPIPSDAPVCFSGAVGDFSVSYLGSPRRELSTDEVFSFQLNISGDGDLKRISPPDFHLGDSFEVYPPRLVEENYFEEAGKRIGHKLYEYVVVPLQAGEYELKPSFCVFDPVQKRFVAHEETFLLKIRQGKVKKSVLAGAEQQDDTGLMDDTELTRGDEPGGSITWFWILFLLPLAIILSIWGTRRFGAHLGREAGGGAIRQRARVQLKEAARYRENGEVRAFFEAISKAVLEYACLRLDIPLAQQSKEGVLQRLELAGMDAATLLELRFLLDRCELVLFAGQQDAGAMEEVYTTAERLIAYLDTMAMKK